MLYCRPFAKCSRGQKFESYLAIFELAIDDAFPERRWGHGAPLLLPQNWPQAGQRSDVLNPWIFGGDL